MKTFKDIPNKPRLEIGFDGLFYVWMWIDKISYRVLSKGTARNKTEARRKAMNAPRAIA